MKVTLGGDRLGSGKKNDLALHNYYRSTHDLSQTFTSPMTVGALYPFLVLPAMRNDKFEINLNADTITIPTKGPLFGSFKLQIDVFQCPIRLYQAILHNNPTDIGLKMNQVLLPTYELGTSYDVRELAPKALNASCLWKYLGLSGIGRGTTIAQGKKIINRKFNAVPLLAYYDIFKNYYSNKQEEKAYVIGGKETIKNTYNIDTRNIYDGETQTELPLNTQGTKVNANLDLYENWEYIVLQYYDETNEEYLGFNETIKNIKMSYFDSNSELIKEGTIEEMTDPNLVYGISLDNLAGNIQIKRTAETPNISGRTIEKITFDSTYINKVIEQLKLQSFDLKNIDEMRMEILSHHTMGTAYEVNEFDKLPYNINKYENSLYPLNGLVVKTYQSDIFNNWINTEWIDGENGIAEITKIATTEGAFKIDALNLAEKLYNMLNRVAVCGGTYEDWQDAVYDEAPHKHIESPIYLGGMSSEIVFEQIVQTSETTKDNPLGSLAGRGRYLKRKGGHIICKCDEASFIIGIASITPRIKYYQGNEFYMTELKTLNDLHKPALDGIGFQNLLGERLAWWDTTCDRNGVIQSRSVVGKVPAWIEYMTAVDKTFGDFTDTDLENDGKAFMVLNRNYEMDEEDGTIKDVTTYIDPTKYNYAFAYTALDAMNFWTEIYSHITARRKMSAKQIPNI